ncbi:hypothetical protein F2P56_026452, partial [Juglans regia]
SQDFSYSYSSLVKRKEKVDFFLFVWKKEEEMARVALVFVISFALFLSIRSVVAEETPALSPMDSDAFAHSQSWGEWFGDQTGQHTDVKSKDDNAGTPVGEPIGAPTSA